MKHFAIDYMPGMVVILDENNEQVEELIQSFETDENNDDFSARVQHRLNILDNTN